jgi:hypothetical protein
MELEGIFNIILVLAILAVAWTILRAILKLTVRLFSIGCFVIVVVVLLGWVLDFIG